MFGNTLSKWDFIGVRGDEATKRMPLSRHLGQCSATDASIFNL